MSGEVRLSRREQEVLNLLVEGFTTGGIAFRLGVSVRRVRNLKQTLRVKLEADCTMTAVARAAQLGLVDAWRRDQRGTLNAE